jgi:hypothetical protein
MNSPYFQTPKNQWKIITKGLLDKHPLSRNEIKNQVLESWKDIFESGFGKMQLKIGKDIFPKPQIMGFLLHELVARSLAKKHPDKWRGEEKKTDKDLVYIPDDVFSIEIKTSSHKDQVFGNRSYAQEGAGLGKTKSGYYLLVNFQSFGDATGEPKIQQVRFGWIDHGDWIGQTSATGQQARLLPEVYQGKLEIV